MKTLLTLALLGGFVGAPVQAQKLSFNFDAIAQKAAKKTELQLDHPPQFTSVDTVAIHSYQFENVGAYADNDLNSLRKQANAAAGWSRFLNVQQDGEHTEIYMLTQNGKPAGFLLIAGKPKELTVIQVSGSIELAQLQELVKSSVHFEERSPN